MEKCQQYNSARESQFISFTSFLLLIYHRSKDYSTTRGDKHYQLSIFNLPNEPATNCQAAKRVDRSNDLDMNSRKEDLENEIRGAKERRAGRRARAGWLANKYGAQTRDMRLHNWVTQPTVTTTTVWKSIPGLESALLGQGGRRSLVYSRRDGLDNVARTSR